jgi:pimeloyl-ACP methyl ester carboxylesterase
MTRYILVPGACHGGWWYQPVVDALRAAGHEADAITLSGLDPDGPPAPAANLDSHIGEVLALLDARGGQAVLVGHSYGAA